MSEGGFSLSLKSALPQIETIVAEAAGRFGVAARDLATGETIEINGQEHYPLASVFKIVTLVELFRQADSGRLELDQRVAFDIADRMPGSGVLVGLTPGFSLTLRDYATLMIIVSDNSATDKVMAAVGRHSLNQTLRQLGLAGISVSRTCGQILASLAGMEVETPTPDEVAEVIKRLQAGESSEATWAFAETEENNVATPVAMVELLAMIHGGRVASAAACAGMIDILRRQQFKQRLPLYLPPKVTTAHKTGTLPGVVNDAGLIYLPNDKVCAVAVLSKQGADRALGSAAIGRIGLAIYEALA